MACLILRDSAFIELEILDSLKEKCPAGENRYDGFFVVGVNACMLFEHSLNLIFELTEQILCAADSPF